MKKSIILLISEINYFFCFIINKINLRIKNVSYSKTDKFKGKLFLCGNGKIFIDDFVTINSGRRRNPIGGDTCTILNTSYRGVIRIGKNSGISNSTLVARESIIIGDKVKIGGSCHIYDTDFHSIDAEERNDNGDSNVKTKPVIIKDGAFIGAFTIILKGVTIGENSVIGAGSIITKDIPDNEIWAGNPATFIKKI